MEFMRYLTKIILKATAFEMLVLGLVIFFMGEAQAQTAIGITDNYSHVMVQTGYYVSLKREVLFSSVTEDTCDPKDHYTKGTEPWWKINLTANWWRVTFKQGILYSFNTGHWGKSSHSQEVKKEIMTPMDLKLYCDIKHEFYLEAVKLRKAHKKYLRDKEIMSTPHKPPFNNLGGGFTDNFVTDFNPAMASARANDYQNNATPLLAFSIGGWDVTVVVLPLLVGAIKVVVSHYWDEVTTPACYDIESVEGLQKCREHVRDQLYSEVRIPACNGCRE